MSNGQTIVIKGEISGDENLVIAGRVEGRIELKGRVLTLAPGSYVEGEVFAGTVIASGQLQGSVEASARVEIHASAVIDGHLSTPSLVVADGAHVSATVDMPAQQTRRKGLEAA
jgi:cytoskeletal protein CcmA (bactofilin family)